MKKNLITPFFVSLLIHVVLLLFFMYSNVFLFFSTAKQQEDVIVLEMVNISDLVNIKTPLVEMLVGI